MMLSISHALRQRKKEIMTNQFQSSKDNDGENTSIKPSSLITSTASRRTFLRRTVVGAAVVAPLGLLAACGGATTGSTSTPTTAPTATATTATLSIPALSASKAAFTEIMNDETAHVSFLQAALTKAGAIPRPKPTFKGIKQTDIMAFANLAQVFENVGVGAYLMAAPAIASKAYLAAAGSILTIEARHAGFLDVLLGKPISANGAFDKPLTQAEIVQDVSPFIVSLNGGSDPSGALKNDADILNFALLLEFLEAEFYTSNVPTLFP